MIKIAAFFLVMLFFQFTPSHAQIVGPIACDAAAEGKIIYNDDFNIMQFCNGTNWVSMVGGGGGGGTPSGAVMAFDLAACPDGWSDYLPARGRFVRGIDPTGTNDPDGVRTAGSVQGDDFRAHNHSVDPPNTITSTNGWHTHTTAIGTTDDNNTPWVFAGLQLGDNGPFSTVNIGSSGAGNHNHSVNIGPFNSASAGGSETRPINVALLYCRKD